MSVQSTKQAVRRWILTGGIAAITAIGAYTGASLKGNQEVIKEKKKLLEATPEERIAQLELARSELVAKKHGIEIKIANLAARRQAKARQNGDAK
ncbi:hypothetical protein BCR34DRAFT_473064 [Clohesyomyces aquaticus]|uniref:Uncharacterized protein n=1 Tax=Clohesyomyces aquaticus TaxID=1231657 RepID=A0A1Y2A8L8_9PLEO|nr:hypothetical protein BCR34DRAFT_473064 [Clohesyomyces aquaticus]